MRLLGREMHLKRCRDGVTCVILVCPVLPGHSHPLPSFCGFWHCHPSTFWGNVFHTYLCTFSLYNSTVTEGVAILQFEVQCLTVTLNKDLSAPSSPFVVLWCAHQLPDMGVVSGKLFHVTI